MSEFHIFYQLGLEHILDKSGYDHIIFIIALCAVYQADDWKSILVLITAFTFGHSLTLVLSALSILQIDQELVEFLIPITILITALINIFSKTEHHHVSTSGYILASGFGLIHGLGFANYLKSLLGREESIITQLFAFNVGLEVGQLIVVAALLAIGFLLVEVFGVSKHDWKLAICAAVAGISAVLILESEYL